MRTEFDEALLRGRDCRFPSWLRNDATDSCEYDELILNSTSISALSFASRCAQSDRFGGKIHIFGKPIEENRRLAAGVTLRARTLDYYAATNGVSREEILRRLYVDDSDGAATLEQRCAMAVGDPDCGFSFPKVGCWMDANKARRNRTPNQPLAYGIRNSRLNRVLQDLAVESGVHLHDELAPDVNALRSHATGSKPLLVNGTPIPLKDAEILHPTEPPTRCVVAVQIPMRAPRLKEKGILHPQCGFATWVNRDGGLDMGVYNPFRDDLSPDATFYGIFYRIMPGPKDLDKETELDYLERTLIAASDALGMEPIDPEETAGRAVVPISPWKGTVNLHEGVLDISRLGGAGAPIISGDGMTRAAVAGFFGAEAVLSGRDAAFEINAALRGYRQINWELSVIMSKMAGFSAVMLGRFPRAMLLRNTLTYNRDMWASAY